MLESVSCNTHFGSEFQNPAPIHLSSGSRDSTSLVNKVEVPLATEVQVPYHYFQTCLCLSWIRSATKRCDKDDILWSGGHTVFIYLDQIVTQDATHDIADDTAELSRVCVVLSNRRSTLRSRFALTIERLQLETRHCSKLANTSQKAYCRCLN